MRSLNRSQNAASFLWLLLFFSISYRSLAASSPAVGRVAVLKGEAQRITVTGASFALKVGSEVFQGDTLTTGLKSAMQVKLLDESVLTLAPTSKLVMSQFPQAAPAQVTLAYGQMRAKVKKSEDKSIKMMIKTPTAAMGIRGTEFETVVNPDTNATSTVTFEGIVAVTKAEPPAVPVLNSEQSQSMQAMGALAAAATPPTLNGSQLEALAKAEAAVESQIRDDTKLTPQQKDALKTVQLMTAKAGALNTGSFAPSAEQAIAIQEVQKISQQVIPPPAPPTANANQIGQMGKLLEALDKKIDTANLPPAQAQAMEEVAKLASNSGKAGEVAITPQQIQALSLVQEMAKTNLAEPQPPTLSSAQAKNLASLQSITAGNAVPEIMSDSQKQALETVKQITDAAEKSGAPIVLSPNQLQAISDVQMLSKTSVDLQSLPKDQLDSLQKANAGIAEVSTPKPPAIPAEMSAALGEMKAVVAEASAPPKGMSSEQAAAIAQLGAAANFVAPAIAPPSLNQEQAKAMQDVASIILKNTDPSQLSPDQAKAIAEVKNLAEAAGKGGAPVALSNNQIQAIASMQQVAMASTIVASTVSPPEQMIRNLNNPEKTVEINQGQFSGMTRGQENPSVPVKISPAQLEGMKNSNPIASISATANSPANAPSAGSVLTPVPPGLNAKLVSGSMQEMQKMMAITQQSLSAPPPLGSGTLGDSQKNADTTNAPGSAGGKTGSSPPPEGFFDAKSGKMAPPAGGFVDLKSGMYVPPPPGSAFDAIAGVFVPPPSMGSFKTETGAYVPPPGFAIDSKRGFVTVAEMEKNSASNGAPNGTGARGGSTSFAPGGGSALGGGMDAFMASAGIPPQLNASNAAGFGSFTGAPGSNQNSSGGFANGPIGPSGANAGNGASSGVMFPGMDPRNFGKMDAPPPPPGFSPDGTRQSGSGNSGSANGAGGAGNPGGPGSPGNTGLPGTFPGSMPGSTPGEMAPGAFPPGSFPPGAYPNGAVPPNSYGDSAYQPPFPVYDPHLCPPYCDAVNQPGSPGGATAPDTSIPSSTVNFNFN